MSEHQHQAAVVDWFKMRYPRYESLIWSNMNGAVLCDVPEKKRLLRMSYLAEEGFKKGVSDLFIAVPMTRYHGLFLEMKDLGKTLSALNKAQRQHLNDVQLVGYAGAWAAGVDQAIEIVSAYMNDQKIQIKF